MKTKLAIWGCILLGSSTLQAKTIEAHSFNPFQQGFSFEVSGIQFAVFPDGEFDFVIPGYTQSFNFYNGNQSNMSFNRTRYEPYLLFDDFGAIVQVENVSIHYDWYGRVGQIGPVLIGYRFGRVERIGSLSIFYRPNGDFWYYDGRIGNGCITSFGYYSRPIFFRPSAAYCAIRPTPYRKDYRPTYYGYNRSRGRSSAVAVSASPLPSRRYNSSSNRTTSQYSDDRRGSMVTRGESNRSSNRGLKGDENNNMLNTKPVSKNVPKTSENDSRTNNRSSNVQNENLKTSSEKSSRVALVQADSKRHY